MSNCRIEEVLETCKRNKKRIFIVYGDQATGKIWYETYGVTGYVSSSMGPNKIYILLHNSKSSGGPAILVNSILRIETTTGFCIYQHPSFQFPKLSVLQDGKYYRVLDVLTGEIVFWPFSSLRQVKNAIKHFVRDLKYVQNLYNLEANLNSENTSNLS